MREGGDYLRLDDFCSKINEIHPGRVEGQGQKARNRGVKKCIEAQTVAEGAFFMFEHNRNGIGWLLK